MSINTHLRTAGIYFSNGNCGMEKFNEFSTQSLIDLLAKETEKYTKACLAKVPESIAFHKTIVDALIREINRREGK